MKKFFLLLCIPAAFVLGCTKEEISNLPSGGNTTDSSSTSTEGSGTSSNVTPEVDPDDEITNTTFTGTITVTYAASGATVEGCSDEQSVSIDGNYVVITNNSDEVIDYVLSGTASDGQFKLYSDKKQSLTLKDLDLTCTKGAAINNQSGKRTFVVVEGTNKLSDSSSAAYATETAADGTEEDMKAVFFSEGQLIFSGSGSLSVSALNKQGKSGIVSDDYVHLQDSPTINVTAGSSAGHGVRGKDYVQLSGGSLNVSTAAAMKKGIGSDNYVLVEGGDHTVNVTGGTAYDSDDSEYKGSAGVKADNFFAMTGGSLSITNSGNGGKGISAGSYDYDSSTHAVDNSYISGGSLSIKTSGSEQNDESVKGIKIGWAIKSGNRVSASAGNLNISGGMVNVSSAKGEGIEAKGALNISGGYVFGYSGYDDGINCQGDLTLSDGYACAWTAGTQTGADGFDANGNIYIKGGVAYGVCTHGAPDVAFDANSEEQKKVYVTGGSIVALGGMESGYSMTGSAYAPSSWSKSTLYGLCDSDGNPVLAFKTPSSGNVTMLLYSGGETPTLLSGVTVSDGTSIFDGNAYAPGTFSGGSNVSVSASTGGNNGGGGPGGGGPGGGGRW